MTRHAALWLGQIQNPLPSRAVRRVRLVAVDAHGDQLSRSRSWPLVSPLEGIHPLGQVVMRIGDAYASAAAGAAELGAGSARP